MSSHTAVTSPAGTWIEYSTPNAEAIARLFCFPYAGGSASIYRPWNGAPLEAIEVCPVQPPGRESRIAERLFTNLCSLAKAVADALPMDKPFAFFGHSAGALLSFEVARELRRRRGTVPFHLFASGCSAPQLCPNRPPRFNLKREQLLTAVRKLGGTPDGVLESSEMLDIILPPLQADFSLLDTYDYRSEAPFDFPMTALSGDADVEVDTWEAQQWSSQTNERFRHQRFAGGHFFLHEFSEAVQLLVAQEVASTLSSRIVLSEDAFL